MNQKGTLKGIFLTLTIASSIIIAYQVCTQSWNVQKAYGFPKLRKVALGHKTQYAQLLQQPV